MALPDGSGVTGRVTRRTKIECPELATASSRHGEDDDHRESVSNFGSRLGGGGRRRGR